MFGGDEAGALVLDLGSNTVRAGYGGDDNPKTVFGTASGYIQMKEDNFVGNSQSTKSQSQDSDMPCYRATNKGKTVSFPHFSRRYYLGNEVPLYRPNQEIISPIQHGLIMDWEAVENICDYAFKNRLYSDPYDYPLLMSEPVYNTKARREKSAQIMFERFDVPAFYLAKDAVLSAFSYGKHNAVVLDIGSSHTNATVVHDGFVLHHPSRMTKVGGDSLDAFTYRNCLLASGVKYVPSKFEYSMHTNADSSLTAVHKLVEGTPTNSFLAYSQQAVIRDIKESLCEVSERPIDENVFAVSNKTYSLPDGHTVALGPERFMVGESLFNVNLGLGAEITTDLSPTYAFNGLHRMVCDAIDLCDVDLRRDLYANILLAGSGVLLPGLHQRLNHEITSAIPTGIKSKVHTFPSTTETRFSSWIGGSILSSLGTFHQMWVSRAEYEEFGAGILLKKCA